MLSPKDLKKLAKTCREAGIKSYKCPEFEFTLTDEAPEPKSYQNKAPIVSHGPQGEVDTDMPDAEAMLYWSVSNPEAIVGQEGDKS